MYSSDQQFMDERAQQQYDELQNDRDANYAEYLDVMEEEENFLQTKKEITAVAFCTKCDTNWSRLPVQNNEDLDEAYETCPVCKQDNFLEDGRAGDTYFYDFEKGVRNTVTGELKEKFVAGMPPLQKKNLSANEKANIDAFYNRQYFVEKL